MPAPEFLAIPQDDYLRLTVTPERVGIVERLLDEGGFPALRLSDEWYILNEDLSHSPAGAALTGGEMWQYRPSRYALAPVQVRMIAEALAAVGEITYSHDLAPVQAFFAEAAARGDAIVTAYR
ncbi:MAG: hypothetical protein GX570_01970 [Corynebacterium marinum]|jgi:hypothetical protein|uniref:Uncharacterized protein n=1 Tax=Corynebacterium marinum TaxID=349751 RepID=A0A847HA09_9CORY|nr:hypothetical protein [Corynebacterium marinum]